MQSSPSRPRLPHERGSGLALALASMLLLAPAASACGGGARPALEVGDVGFAEDELRGLSPERRLRLAEITALGLAVARGEAASLGEPWIHRRRTDLLLERLAADVALEDVGVTEDVLRARYETSPQSELVVRHLVVLSERWRPRLERERARRRAEEALARIRDGAPFPEVAAEYSDEPGAAERGGLLRPGRRGTWVPEFWDAAESLEKEEVSDVVETEYGFHVLRLEERRAVPFEEARAQVVAEVAALSGGVAEAFDAWARDAAAGLHVPDGALEGWWSEPPPDTATVAIWPGGRWNAGGLRLHLAGLEAREWERIQEDPAALSDAAHEGARRALLAARAEARGVELSAAEAAPLLRNWESAVARWAGALGFREGMPVAGVKEQALRALGETAQGAGIAREELAANGPLLRHAYPPRVGETRRRPPA